jgi:hypothetical protein
MKRFSMIYIFFIVCIILSSCKKEVKTKVEKEAVEKRTTTEHFSFVVPEGWSFEEVPEEYLDYSLYSPDTKEFVVITYLFDMGHHGSAFIANDIEFMTNNGFELLDKKELDTKGKDIEGFLIRYKGSVSENTNLQNYESYIFIKGHKGIIMGINYPENREKSDELEKFLSSFIPFPED